MQIIKGIAIAAVLIIAGLLALIVAAVRLFLNSRYVEFKQRARRENEKL